MILNIVDIVNPSQKMPKKRRSSSAPKRKKMKVSLNRETFIIENKIYSVNYGVLLDLNFKLTMSMDSGLRINSRLVSSTQKREIMWNIIEPGDPYDIRKSMIAKLPGRKNFMGEHLQLVCLLQAAEIERISEYLDEYKLKFREIERRELDRHSYQIQIKQLTQQLSQDGAYKLQNSKLKEFIRKQTIQFEELKKKSGGLEIEISRKYDDSLRQVESLLQENQLLKSNANKTRLDFQQTLNSKNLEVDELQRRLTQLSSSHSSQYSQKNEAYFKLQIEYKKLEFENKRVKQIIETKNQEIQELQSKSKQFLYQIEEMNSQLQNYSNINHTITEYENRFSLLGKEIDRLNLVLREKTADLSDSNNRIKVLDEEVRRKNDYINELERRKTEVDQRYLQLEAKMVESMKNLTGLDQSRNLVKNYEVNLEKLSSEIERLNIVLKKKVQQLDESNKKKNQYEYQLRKSETVLKELDDYRFKYGEFNKKFADYESKIALLSQEIERLNQVLRRKEDEGNTYEQQLKIKKSEVESMKKKNNQMENEYRNQMNRITIQNQQFQSRIAQLTQQNEFNRGKIEQLIQQIQSSPSKTDIQQYYHSQIERLTLIIQSKTVQIQRYQTEKANQPKVDPNIFQLQKERIIQQYELQLSNKNKEINKGRQTISEYEKRIISSAQQIQRLSILLKRKSAEVSPSKQKEEELNLQYRKLSEYENKLAIMTQEIQRLNENLRSKINENKNLESRLRNTENELETSRKRQSESFSVTINELERKISVLDKENEYLKEEISRKDNHNQQTSSITKEYDLKLRQITEENSQLGRTLKDYEFQINTLSQQIQRLNNILQAKVNQNSQHGSKVKKLTFELQQTRRKLAQYESKISQISRESEFNSEKISRNAQYEIQTLKRKINELEAYNSQYQSTVREYEEQIYVSRQEKEKVYGQVSDHQKKFTEYENKIVILSQEIQRLNQLLGKISNQNNDFKRKAGEIDYLKTTIVTLEEKFSRAAQENDELRRGVNQSNVNRTRLSQDFESKMRSLSQQNDDLIRKYKELESKISYQSSDYDHLSSVLKSKTEEINTYDSKLKNSYQQNESLNRKIQQLTNINRKISQYETKIAILSQQIQRLNTILRTKVDQINALEGKCRNYQNQLASFQRKTQEYETTINRDLQTKISFISKQNEDLKIKVKQLTNEVNKLPEFESKFSMVYGEVQRLNTILRSKTDEIHSLQNKARTFQQQIDKYRRRNQDLQNSMHRQLKNQSSVFEQRVTQLTEQNDNLRKNLRELSDANRKIGEYENKVIILSKEIERLNDILVKYSKQMIPELEEKNRKLNFENEDFKRKVNQLGEVNKNNQQLLTKFRMSVQQNEQYSRKMQEYEARMTHISNEVQRLNNVLRQKHEELGENETKLQRMINQKETLTMRLRESSDINKKIPQYENKVVILTQEIERLNSILKNKVDGLNNSENELRKIAYEYQTLQRRNSDLQEALEQFKSNRVSLEQKLSEMNRENEQIRRTVRELSDSNRRIGDYESRMTLLSQQIERLNVNLRTKTEERNSLEGTLKTYQKDSQVKITNLGKQLEDYRKKTGQSLNIHSNKIAEYENKILLLSQQIERLNYVLKEHIYQIQVFQKKEAQYLAEIERLNNTLRLKVEETTRWQQSNNELKIRMKSYEENLHLANQEYENLKKSHSVLTEQYTKANKHLVQYEQSINKLYQEFQRLQAIMNDLKKENYDLKIKLQESGNLIDKNRALSAEIDRLTKIVDNQNRDLEDLRLNLADQAALQKRINEDMGLMVVLFAEIESLRKRVKQTEIQIESVRRSSLAPFKV